MAIHSFFFLLADSIYFAQTAGTMGNFT